MWFSLFATILILAIAFYEGLHGLFTGLINCILAVISVALAFGLYEDLYEFQLQQYQPEHGRAIALMSIFVVTLLILRTVFDMVIKGNLQFPVYLDRAGGGLFGFINGMLIVGMLSIGFEMLPFGDTVMGYGRFTMVDKDSNNPVTPADVAGKDPAQFKYVRSEPWLKQDAFTLALASHLSNNSLAGRTRLDSVYPDFMATIYRAQARMGDKDHFTPEASQSFEVEGFWPIKQTDFFVRDHKDKENLRKVSIVPAKDPPAPGTNRVVLRIKSQGSLQFAREQVRLVIHDAGTARTSEYLPVGISDDLAGNKLVQIYDGELFTRQLSDKNTFVDFVFELPEGLEIGEDSFFEYKQNGRAPINASMAKNDKTKPKGSGGGSSGKATNTTSDAGTSGKPTNSALSRVKAPTQEGRDRVSGLGPPRGGEVTDKFPVTLTEYTSSGEVANGEFRGGSLVATLDDTWTPISGSKPPVERFQTSSNLRLMQISVEKLHPGSTYGQAMDFARSTLNDYKLVDQNGKEWMLVGMYAFARVNGKPTLEVSYLDETGRGDGAVMGRATPLKHIKKGDLSGDYALYYLYQVPVGTKAVEIRTGRTPIPLREFNIEAK